MAITTEIIGRFGGGVDTIPVEVPENQGNTLIHTVSVPPGEKLLVSVIGHSPKMPGTAYAPTLEMGADSSSPTQIYGVFSVSGVLEEDTGIWFKPRASSGINNSSFTGHVYTVKL